MLELVDRFWRAVKKGVPEAWTDKKDYILLQAIGLGAFAKLGGVVLERTVKAGTVGYDDMLSHLKPVADAVTLKRDDYKGIAGAGGADFIARKIRITAADADAIKKDSLLKALGGEKETPTALDS